MLSYSDSDKLMPINFISIYLNNINDKVLKLNK